MTAYVKALVAFAKREPIRTFAVLRSLFLVLAAFWPGLISGDQQTALLTLAAAWLAIDEVVRQNTTSTAEPHLNAGTAVTVITPKGQPNRVETV